MCVRVHVCVVSIEVYLEERVTPYHVHVICTVEHQAYTCTLDGRLILCNYYSPMSRALAMRFVATSLIVLWEAPEERMVAARQALLEEEAGLYSEWVCVCGEGRGG